VLEEARRDDGHELHPAAPAGELPAYLRDRLALGPHVRGALRPVPRNGRVLAAGIDTLSPCWYAEPGAPLARAIAALATQQAHRAWLLPDPVGGYRVGWFDQPGLVFAEGRPGGEALCAERLAALDRLKPDERTAIGLQAAGFSYREIGERQEWTQTKINRCLAEGRAALRAAERL
jgi:hypothetical protein